MTRRKEEDGEALLDVERGFASQRLVADGEGAADPDCLVERRHHLVVSLDHQHVAELSLALCATKTKRRKKRRSSDQQTGRKKRKERTSRLVAHSSPYSRTAMPKSIEFSTST